MNISSNPLSALFCFVLTASFSAFTLAEAGSQPLQQDEIRQQGMQLIDAFSKELKAKLKHAIKEGGLSNGIEVCAQTAPEIALRHSQQQWQVKRTSLKVRNPANTPSAEELKVLEAFESAKAGGKAFQDLSYYGVTDKGTQRVHHLMQAIPTQALCLGCHGEKLSEDVQAALSRLYPDDQATGFQEGDIRGAFSLFYTENKLRGSADP